jgi:uncharacterized protein (TIGR00297 family)
MVGWALLLRVLSWPQAALLALTALLINSLILPRVGGRALFRTEREAGGVPGGIVFYALSVLILILIFRERLDIVAAAWAILAVGDGMATIVGRAVGGAHLPWNGEKTVAGSVTFAVAGGAAAVFFCWWTQPNVAPPAPAWFVIGAPLVAAAVAALVETIPVRLDDNLSVPFSAAAVLWVASLVDIDRVREALPLVTSRIGPALLVSVTFAALAYALRSVSWSGVVVGSLIGVVVYLGLGLSGWIMLFATFLAAAATSKVGWRRKAALGIAEEREGRRGAGNALANCLVSAVAAMLWEVSRHPVSSVAFVAGLAAGASDTVASEIGKAWGRRTYLVIGFRPVSPGTPGAISLEGTIANLVAAAALAALGAELGLMPYTWVPAVVVGALAGSLVESVLAATLEHRGILNNDLLNFINTAVAVAVALGIWDSGFGI